MNPAQDFAVAASHTAEVNSIRIAYARAGQGPALLLLHGWPFTHYTWRLVLPALAERFTVIAPDLRGIGQSSRPATGYDLHTKAADARALLHHLGFERARVMGHDMGMETAYMTALRYPDLVERLVLSEAVVGGLPGAEEFLAHAPWWFGFHGVPDLPEHLIAGREDLYLNWFYEHQTFAHGLAPEARAAYVAAYSGVEGLRGGFAHYRAFGENRQQVQAAFEQGQRLTCPTLAVCGNVVGEVLGRQLRHVADYLDSHIIPECGHVPQEEQPARLLALLHDFL